MASPLAPPPEAWNRIQRNKGTFVPKPTVPPASYCPIKPLVDGHMISSEYDDIFKECGAKYNIDWQALKALGLSESDLNPDITHGTAIGIMQVENIHWSEVGAESMTAYSMSLHNPAYNICEGARILRMFLNRHPDFKTAVGYYKGYLGSTPANAKEFENIVYPRFTNWFTQVKLEST